jgi:dTDP-4-dehydrorhamnose reductase
MINYSLNKLLITGSHGQLASALRHHARANQYVMAHCSRKEMDITNLSSIAHAITYFRPDIIINTAAYTAVDKAEQETQQALHTNYEGAKNLAQLCTQMNIPLIHISTDYVFSGTQATPYHENNPVKPINFYGKSKWLGEQAIRKYCTQHIILRTSGVFSEYRDNFLKTILRLAREKKELRIIADQITCPTYAGDIASVILSIIKQPLIWGTYHYCSNKPVSWHKFAIAILEEAKKYQLVPAVDIQAILAIEYPTVAQRPAYSVLNCSKISNTFNIPLISWLPGLRNSIRVAYLLDAP